MNKFIILTLLLCSTLCYGQTDKFYRHEAQFTSGLNTQEAFEMELAYSFLFNKYIGITVGLNMMDQSYQRMMCSGAEDYNLFQSLLCGCDDYDDYLFWESRKVEYASALLFRPAVRFSYPLLKESGDDVLFFNMETGLFMSLIPNERLTFDREDGYYGNSTTVKNRGGEWLFYHLKSYLSLNLDRFLVSVGYSISNFDIFDSRRNMVVDGIAMRDTLRDKKNTSTVFLAVAYRF
ncbi:hypothetical protein M2459_003572 [Parabacteroides sp. PF5-5]|uniref:hypothetical protein n=1 Tax=unclassified Parabacteroides TaxID=2649774 RepID=UPI002476C38D|nr:MULTISPECIES: hypothetical protein [unclassified Parabacteroides]MDH6306928.1 hypothetical protein [Parabacteroides sp. PH5-39]MDH6317811.1 hypothetical protein [Parabacteroides sp. PF5-13]MDH6321533.1 hypothetical protein [Parabacteroides sp. PH5-13]MDH6325315.1 hypothetical protein [Parabacteroides sp. PH5-8]MDH6328986.1 hypothetical protein [Parabacteroides sp. PH5-41]